MSVHPTTHPPIHPSSGLNDTVKGGLNRTLHKIKQEENRERKDKHKPGTMAENKDNEK